MPNHSSALAGSNLIAYSAVTVHGRVILVRVLHQMIGGRPIAMAIEQRADDAAIQKLPQNASYFFSGFQWATTIAVFLGKLRICNPSGLAGPQPQQALFGAYFFLERLRFFHL